MLFRVFIFRICEATHVREGRNDKELSVQRGEILEVSTASQTPATPTAVGPGARRKSHHLQWKNPTRHKPSPTAQP